MTLPLAFCWTRIGVEAGQSIESICRRKEEERTLNGCLFFWGIGNAIGPSIAELIRHSPQPEVIFSPIKSAARAVDVSPRNVVAWTRAEDLEGRRFELPAHALITSRFDASNPKTGHYALVCASRTPLIPANDSGTLDIGDLENLLTGRPVGASQVTAVVRRVTGVRAQVRTYRVALRARLEVPFFLHLRNPVILSGKSGMQNWDSVVGDTWAARVAP